MTIAIQEVLAFEVNSCCKQKQFNYEDFDVIVYRMM